MLKPPRDRRAALFGSLCMPEVLTIVRLLNGGTVHTESDFIPAQSPAAQPPPPARDVPLTDRLTDSLGEHDLDRTLSSLERTMAAIVTERSGIRVPGDFAALTTIREWLTWAATQDG